MTDTTPKISDVATRAGVSTGTVSRVINRAANVRQDTRAKVNEAIAALGYEPNFQARSLRSHRSETIALALPELSNHFWMSIARGVQDAAQAKGYYVLICNTNDRSGTSLRYLDLLINRADGLILSRSSEQAIITPNAGVSNHRHKPIVFVGQSQAANWNVDNVYSDSISGAFALTQHLIHLGHKRIAIITGNRTSNSAADRVAGYGMALAEAQVPLDHRRICWGEYDRQTAERLTHALLERLPDTTGIVAANNEIAVGVIRALEKRQVAVPEAVAVVGFDDFSPDTRFATLMTVASQSPYDLGLNAAQLLLNRLNHHAYLRPQTVVLPARLIVRASSGGAPSLIEPETTGDNVSGQLIPRLPRQKIEAWAAALQPIITVALPASDVQLALGDRAHITALQRVLRRTAAASVRPPHFEYAISSRALYRYVLEREPEIDGGAQTTLIAPEDQIEFAQRTGLAAIACRPPYRPALAPGTSVGEVPALEFPLLTDILDFFDRYVRAAQNTKVGIAADFRSLVGDTDQIVASFGGLSPEARRSLLIKVAQDLADYQAKVVQLVCDRFGADLAFVIFSDDLADARGLRWPLDIFQSVFSEHLRRLLHVPQEHGLPTVLHTPGALETLIPLIRQLGFDGVYIAQAEGNDLPRLRTAAAGQLSFMGGLPLSALNGSALPGELRARLAQLGGPEGYVVGVAGAIDDHVPIDGFLSLVSALPHPNA